jgi:hypothetical protein
VEIFSRQPKKAIAWRRNFSRIWGGAHAHLHGTRDEWGCVWFCARKVRRFRRRTVLSLNGQDFAFKKTRHAVCFVAPEMREASSRFDSFQRLVGRVLKGIRKRLPNINA